MECKDNEVKEVRTERKKKINKGDVKAVATWEVERSPTASGARGDVVFS